MQEGNPQAYYKNTTRVAVIISYESPFCGCGWPSCEDAIEYSSEFTILDSVLRTAWLVRTAVAFLLTLINLSRVS